MQPLGVIALASTGKKRDESFDFFFQNETFEWHGDGRAENILY